MELPKVNIAVAASAVVAIVSTVGGGIWYASQQASIIDGLTSQVERLTIENNATDRTNLIRDVENNSENIDEIYEEIDALHEETASMAQHMMAIIKLQARVAVLEKTVEFTRKDGM